MALLPFIIHAATKGTKSFSEFDEVFAFLSRIPFVSAERTEYCLESAHSSYWLCLQGGQVLSFYIGLVAPYSSSISARILKLTKQESVVAMSDLSWLRNPFNSVHALALANLAELTSGLGVMTAMQHAKSVRGIVTRSGLSADRPVLAACARHARFGMRRPITDNPGMIAGSATLFWM